MDDDQLNPLGDASTEAITDEDDEFTDIDDSETPSLGGTEEEEEEV